MDTVGILLRWHLFRLLSVDVFQVADVLIIAEVGRYTALLSRSLHLKSS